jgi:hypothetical protein
LARLRPNRTHFPNIKAALGIQINFGDARWSSPMGVVALQWSAKYLADDTL